MKTTKILVLAACAAVLTACETAPPPGGAASFQGSAQELGRYNNAAPGTPAYDQNQPPTSRYMYQHNESGLFGNRSSSGVIQSTGPIQSYQTIGNMPVYPGMPVPMNPYPNYPTNNGYYVHPATGQMVPMR